MGNPIRWIAEWIEALHFVWASTRKDKDGKLRSLSYFPDDIAIRDFHSVDTIFARRIFLSYERDSLPLARRFEAALKAEQLEPWRYEPSAVEKGITLERSLQMKEMQEKYPETARALVATVRRCPAVIFIVSRKSLQSAYCELEAFVASAMHDFWPKNRIRNEAGVYVVLEEPGLSASPWLKNYWSRAYEDGLEDALSAVIAHEIPRLSAIVTEIETHRSKTYR